MRRHDRPLSLLDCRVGGSFPVLAAGLRALARQRRAAAAVPRTDVPGAGGAPDDEPFWAEVQRAFTVDRSLVNLNNGGVSPSPAYVQEAMKRHLDFSNQAPTYTMWRVLEPQIETVRVMLADRFGCDAEEIAITRGASESLQICQAGIDLRRGDQVVTTTQDYPRMITTWQQRERREGIELIQVEIPVPAEDSAEVVPLIPKVAEIKPPRQPCLKPPVAGVVALLFAFWKTLWVSKQDEGDANMKEIAAEIRKGGDAQPEEADTVTAGIVYQPSWFDGFSGPVWRIGHKLDAFLPFTPVTISAAPPPWRERRCAA